MYLPDAPPNISNMMREYDTNTNRMRVAGESSIMSVLVEYA